MPGAPSAERRRLMADFLRRIDRISLDRPGGYPAAAPAEAAVLERPIPEHEPPAAAPAAPRGQERPYAPAAAPAASRRRLWALALPTAAALAAGTFWLLGHPRTAEPAAHAAFALESPRALGLARSPDGSFLSIDPRGQALMALSADGRMLSRQRFPNPSLSGFALGHGLLWSADMETGFVFEHEPAAPFALRKAVPLPGVAVSALFDDGADLWVGDARSELVRRYEFKDGELAPRARYTLPGTAASALFFADGKLWVLDSLNRKVWRYRVADTAQRLDAFDFRSFVAPASEATGLWVDGGELWLVAENPASLHRFALNAVAWAAAP